MSLLQEFSSAQTLSPFGVKCCNCGGVKRPWDMFLPITHRGSFFQDSFFSNLHQHFHATVREILNKWCDSDLKLADHWDDINARHTDILDRYRQLRSRNLREENQAVAVTSDDTSRKVVMDVHDFMGGDVKVKVVGEKDLVVEGSVEKKEGGPSVSSHSFRRRFSLPRLTDLSAIDSVMSSDGILTITTPKIESDVQHKTTIIPIQMEETHNESEGNSSASFKCEHCSQEQTSVNGSSSKQEIKVPIQNYQPHSEANKSQPKENQITQEPVQSSPSSRLIPIEIEANEATANETTNAASLKKEIQPSEPQLRSSGNDNAFQFDSFPGHFFPITRRGLFFNDSFFQDSWKDFQKAVREVLAKWGEQSSLLDDLTCYRNLRSRDLREDTQAVTSSEDDHHHKFVIDVQDFTNGGEINVKAVNDRELVVSGHIDKNEDGAKSTKRFLRRFTVPGDIQLDAVTSVMSSDGVLTISAPKKHSTLQIEEVFSPLSIDGSEKKLGTADALQANPQPEIQTPQGSSMAPWTTSPGATATPVGQQTSSQQTSNSPNKEDSYLLVTAVPARVEEVQDGAETQPSSIPAPPKPAGKEGVSVRPKSFGSKGKKDHEGEEEAVDYKAALKPRTGGGKFPIKISGTVIGSNAV
ncbi:uncharacterized protein LOC122267833 [Penaeus japonicus]|uniref:uncharacterized protein LOC122267833 n=1 Tax=Penaeus japonicus TaxID=27405 RepID=UPI001C71746F|nr:uncharacterized protein LOC122267833 [Penaeus japonicus]